MKKKICISFFLALVMVLTVAIPVSGSFDTSSDTYYVADDLSNYSMIECFEEESDMISYDYITGEETYYKVVMNDPQSTRSGNTQKYWPGYVPECAAPVNESSSNQTRNLIGTDNRIEVTNNNVAPYSYIAYIESELPTRDENTNQVIGTSIYGGTAWFVSKNVLVTAAHNVWDQILNIPGEDITVIPKCVSMTEDGTYVAPYGTYTPISIIIPSLYKHGDATTSALNDYAVIVLGENIGNSTGWFSFTSLSNPANQSVVLCGYAKYKALSNYPFKLYYQNGTTEYENGYLRYAIDASRGQSGSPVYISGNIAIGLHNSGHDGTLPKRNYGLPITSAMYTIIMGAISDYN